jgi:hypothetical protein
VTAKPTTAYRFEDVSFAGPEDDPGGGYLRVQRQEFTIIRWTKCGFWISFPFGSDRFVLNTAKKKFACTTKEEALASFKARKKRQRSILQQRLNEVSEALRQVDDPDWRRIYFQ